MELQSLSFGGQVLALMDEQGCGGLLLFQERKSLRLVQNSSDFESYFNRLAKTCSESKQAAPASVAEAANALAELKMGNESPPTTTFLVLSDIFLLGIPRLIRHLLKISH